jgi:hypothetical protein
MEVVGVVRVILTPLDMEVVGVVRVILTPLDMAAVVVVIAIVTLHIMMLEGMEVVVVVMATERLIRSLWPRADAQAPVYL